MIPPEIMKWADLPTIALIILASQILRPIVAKTRFIQTDPDRIIIVPLGLGLVIGILVEFGSGSFDLHMAVRHVLVDAFGAAGMFRAGKIAVRRSGASNAGNG